MFRLWCGAGCLPRPDGRLRTAWISGTAGSVNAPLRLFCFGHAGGGGAFFRTWQAPLLPEIEICPLVLPGREARLKEPPYTSMEALAGPLFDALLPFCGKPFAFFGHSVGAAVAYAIARRFAAHTATGPLCLFVSGRRAPHIPPRHNPRFSLPDAEFIHSIRLLNGIPDQIFREPELIALFLPALRADFQINDTYLCRLERLIPYPVSAFLGDADDEVSLGEMSPWADVTSGRFALRVFPGDHFYLKDAPAPLLRTIRSTLQQAAPNLF